MELKKQVSSLELSKKLKELGVKQESLFFYNGRENVLFCGSNEPVEYKVFTSAFTVAELGEMLPLDRAVLRLADMREDEDAPKDAPYFWEVKNIGGWAKNEADQRAEMLIYLLENNLITNDAPHHQ